MNHEPMAYRVTARAQSMSSQPLAQRITEEPVTTKNAQSTVTCVYQTHIGGYWRNVTILWNKNIMNHSLNISVDSVSSNLSFSCKIDLKPWHFWAKKGYKTFEVDGFQVDAYWDLRSAKFSGSPEPCSDFYVTLICEEEVVLLIGDLNKKVYKRTKARPALVEPLLFYKKEHVFGKKSFTTRAKFDYRRKDYEIVVESSSSGPKDPEMWVSIDGIVMIHIRNLQWKFRGNQTVMVNKQPIEVLWDVHAWLFCNPGTSHGLFIFKPGAEPESDKDEVNSQGDGYEGSKCSGGSKYYSTISNSNMSQFCLFLYAWKIE